MANLTEQALYNLPFGYLSGSDLSVFCAAQILISRYQVNPAILQNGCNMAYAQITGKLNNRYNIGLELEKIAFTNGAATSTVSGGAVTAINITYAGTSYAVAPTVTIGGPGIGASATAIVANGIVTGITVDNAGTGYTNPPIIMLTGGAAPDTRSQLLVQIVTLQAIRNILGGIASVSKELEANFKWSDMQVQEIRDAQLNLPLQLPPGQTDAKGNPYQTYSSAALVCNSWGTLG